MSVPTISHTQSPREQLEQLESERDKQRQKMEELGRQKLEIDNAMTKLARTLEKLDQDIEGIETSLLKSKGSNTAANATIIKAEVKSEKEAPADALVAVKPEAEHIISAQLEHQQHVASSNDTNKETEHRTEPYTNPYLQSRQNNNNLMTMTTQYDDNEILTDPNAPTMTMPVPPNEYLTEPNDGDDDDFRLYDDDDEDPDEHDENEYVASYIQQQQPENTAFATAPRKNLPLSTNEYRDSVLVTGTLMPTQPNHDARKSNGTLYPDRHGHHVVTPPNETTTTTTTYPWTAKIYNLLQTSFRIPSFREQQLDIINTTMQGLDVFVIMRTGGGKSLTYQLPALYEGRHGGNQKVTLVISPLLSLIQDQEEQMNMFAPGSAVSFTSSIGTAEHTRRWNQVQDPNGGVCIIFCTPEKVSKSNRLCAELDKLHARNRLGRFVIDEAHCACQWGHDFRPDYAKLGKLKSHFPSIPIIAVTATASDRVRDDVCEILRIRQDYQFFRSTFRRPNLIYSVVPKPDNKDNTIELMVNFIKTKYPRDAGIVYTYTRKEAETVADALCNLGVIAEVSSIVSLRSSLCYILISKPIVVYAIQSTALPQ